jgi:hypothetical protein
MPATEVIMFVFNENATTASIQPTYIFHHTYVELIGAVKAYYHANGHDRRYHVDIYCVDNLNIEREITRQNYRDVMHLPQFFSWLNRRSIEPKSVPEE